MIVVTIKRDELVAARACHNGIELFDSLKAHQDEQRRRAGKPERASLRVVWSRLAMVWLATAYPWAWSWARDAAVFPSLSLRDANLRGAYLGGANLGCANLRDADLRGAYLGGANLGCAYLWGADLRDADLGGANLRGANLGGAYLRGAYLGGANLGGAYLGGADLGSWERGPDGYARRKAVAA